MKAVCYNFQNFLEVTGCLYNMYNVYSGTRLIRTPIEGTCHSVRIIRVSVISELSKKTSGTHVLSI